MVLYKYLPPVRLDVLEKKRIRFTQPGAFNDPFEFRPCIQSAVAQAHVREYVEANFEQLVDQELAQYPLLSQFLPDALIKELLHPLKSKLPELYQLLEPHVLPRVSSAIDGALNQSVGVLCLSEIKDSILMWGHYTDNHQGFVVGFDSNHPFFSRRRSDEDEFGFLRQVDYRHDRPKVILSDTSSPAWFQTKCAEWAYEKEWRIVRVLFEAEHRIEGPHFPVCLFEFPAEAVSEIIIGMRSPAPVTERIRSLALGFPRAALLSAREDPSEYRLLIDRSV
jgi:hypothetical protein